MYVLLIDQGRVVTCEAQRLHLDDIEGASRLGPERIASAEGIVDRSFTPPEFEPGDSRDFAAASRSRSEWAA